MKKQIRSSNIELYRIVMMLIIIAHHFVVNSGVTAAFDFNNVTGNMLFLYLFGFGGKSMIDGFLLITGFFMIKSRFSIEKVLKIFLEILFYEVGFYLLFCALGIHAFDPEALKQAVLYVFYHANKSFPATYFWLYLLSPVLNILVTHLNKRQHLYLLGVLLVYFTFISTFIRAVDTFSELGWYITVYLIGGYLQLYEPKFLNCGWKNAVMTLLSLLACFAGILVIIHGHATKTETISPYYYVNNAHKLMGLILAVCSFQWFRHIKMRNSRIINTIASSIFGVLLIHANSDTMRKWLWQDLLDIRKYYTWRRLPLYAVVCVIGIFLVCAAIDLIRIHALEKPFFKLYRKAENSILQKIHKQRETVQTQ